MSAQSDTEKVLRSLHVLLSKSEPYAKEPSKVIVDKQQMLDLLNQLNTCIYQIMDEYELTKRSRDKAERDFRRQGDQIIMDASHKAEDVYAASVIYMDEALNRIQDIMRKTSESVSRVYEDMDAQMKNEIRRVKENQSELKSQLQDMTDTEKYLKLIEECNKEIEKQKNEGKPEEKKEPSIYADRQTEIKVNQEYLDKLGMSIVDALEEEENGAADTKDDSPQKKAMELEIQVDLDADYFKWKEQHDAKETHNGKAAEQKSRTQPSADSSQQEEIHKVWKNLTGNRK